MAITLFDNCFYSTRSSEDAHFFLVRFYKWRTWLIGLLVGGLFQLLHDKLAVISDMITRFSGFTIGSIMTGVIWIGKPESFLDVILYDNFHVILWFGGLILF